MRAVVALCLLAQASAAFAVADLIARIVPGSDPAKIGARYGVTVNDVTEDAPFVLYDVPPGMDPHTVQAQMRLDPQVVWVEDNPGVEMPEHGGAGRGSTIGAVGEPDLFYKLNSGFLQQIRWVRPFRLMPTNRVRVAVLDTGLSPLQPYLWSRVDASLNAVERGQSAHDLPMGQDTNGNGTPDEAAGHGTMVAGIVAQIAPHSRLVIVRAADSDGYGTAWTLTKGLAFAVTSGARVANVSLGSLNRIPAISDVLDWTEEWNLAVAAAAGNNGRRTQFHPATISKVISVTGVDASDKKASFANWDSSVDSCAPATGIKSFWWDGTFGVWSGTSFASPMVAGAVAVVLDIRPLTPARALRDAVADTGDDIDGLNEAYRGQIGTRLNVRRLFDSFFRVPPRRR